VLGRPYIARVVASCVVASSGLLLAAVEPAHATAGQTGYDISYPQCNGSSLGSTPSSPGSFDILGVNGGLVYSPNPCLAAQYHWATTSPPAPATVSFYANTANPGPRSSHWPAGQASPKPCPAQKHYRANTQAFDNCSYDYGWNAAANSFTDAANASTTSVAAGAQWWLDVESANSWTSDQAANIADIQGGLDSLKNELVPYTGIYTNSSSWSSITGSTTKFNGYPFWAPGATSATAANTCSNPAASVTGGHIRYVQYQSGGFDTDYDCG
jgi:hypothetical protein